MNKISFLVLFILLIISCKDKEQACTEEFRMISITVNGEGLSNVYTVRQSNNDTIINNQNSLVDPNTYVVLDDNYLPKLKNQTDDFLFVGEIDGNKVVEEMFTIRADECHVEYVSGNTDIDL